MLKGLLTRKTSFLLFILFVILVSVVGINTTARAAPVPGTYYTLKAVHSGKCLDVQSPNTADGSKIDQYTCNGNPWQNWSLVDKGSGYYSVVSQNSGKCLDVNGASTADLAQIIQWTCGSGTNQQWQLVASGTDYQLKARHSGKCLDVNGASTADGGLAVQYTCGTGNNQKWTFTVAGAAPTNTPVPPTAGPTATKTNTPVGPTATKTNTPVGPTATPVANKYEAENAVLSGGAAVATDHTGYSGTGFVAGYFTGTGQKTSFTVNVATAGSYNVTLHYSNSIGSAQTESIYVNGTKVATPSYPNLANWDTWANSTTALTLNAGNNTIVYQKDSGDGCINLDYITVAPGVVSSYYLTLATTTGGSTNPAPGTYTYSPGTSVTITALPASGYTFTGWSYAVSGTANPLVLVMDDNKLLTANFAPAQTNTFTLTITATGNGTTNPAPGTYTYNSGTSVAVSAVPASGATFTGWSGAATGTTSPVNITMNANKTLTAAFSGGTPILACSVPPGAPPTGTGPLPSPAQAAYQRTEMTAFIHYSMATYDGSEQGNPSDPPSLFNPSNLNATTVGQWVSSLKAAGFRQVMLVTKHSVGFTLWPSAYTSYSVKSSLWMNGTGDVVRLFRDAMDNAGMRVALYLAPWDQKYPSSSSSSSYETYYKNQVYELLNYGPAYEFEFDGFNAPTSNVNWKSVFQLIKQNQPNILLWAGPEIVNTGAVPDLQWIGNENGQATRLTSSLDTHNCGGGNTWCPFECNVSSRRPNWFWHPNGTVMSLSDMQKVYFATVGMNCTLNFNVPPSQTGAFDPADLNLLQQFGTWYSGLYKTNLVKGRPATADSTWANAGFDAAKAVDDDVCTYWAAGSGRTTARYEVPLASPASVKLISIREAIELGERVKTYHVEIKQNGTWNTTPTDSSGVRIQGTVIGQRQLWQVNLANVQAVALVIDSAKDAPAIAEFSVH